MLAPADLIMNYPLRRLSYSASIFLVGNNCLMYHYPSQVSLPVHFSLEIFILSVDWSPNGSTHKSPHWLSLMDYGGMNLIGLKYVKIRLSIYF
jgi:hypothetical protein